LAACGDLYAVAVEDLITLYGLAVQMGFDGTEAAFIADGSVALADLLPPTAVNFTLGCSSAAASLQGWPTPACTVAQAVRSAVVASNSGVWTPAQAAALAANMPDMPLLFNSSAVPGMVAALAEVYSRIRARSHDFIHRSLLPYPIAAYSSSTTLLDTAYGWQTARAHANSISAMMQAQHGCGLYCIDPIALGVGSSSLVWNAPSSSQNEPSLAAAAAPLNRSAIIYVQRSRPAVVCDNASFSLPWLRFDPNEYYTGDISNVHLSTGARGIQTARLPAPLLGVLFRTRSWTDVHVSSGKQSILTLLGSTAGLASTILAVLVLLKQHSTYNAWRVVLLLQWIGCLRKATAAPPAAATPAENKSAATPSARCAGDAYVSPSPCAEDVAEAHRRGALTKQLVEAALGASPMEGSNGQHGQQQHHLQQYDVANPLSSGSPLPMPVTSVAVRVGASTATGSTVSDPPPGGLTDACDVLPSLHTPSAANDSTTSPPPDAATVQPAGATHSTVPSRAVW